MPVAFHDCTGPVALAVSTHLALNTRNCWVQEMVRAFYYGWYHRFVTVLPPVAKGQDHGAGGAGTRARPATRDRATPRRRRAAHDAQRSLRRRRHSRAQARPCRNTCIDVSGRVLDKAPG